MADLLQYTEQGIQTPSCKRCLKPKGEWDTEEEAKEFCRCGRPTKYNPSFVEDMVSWFQSQRTQIYNEYSYHKPSDEHVKIHYAKIEQKLTPDDEVQMQGGLRAVSPKVIRALFPTFQRYASELKYTMKDKEGNDKEFTGVSMDSLALWAVKHEEFYGAVIRCKEIQEALLLECGLNGTYIHKMVELVLQNNFGYTNKQQIDMTTNGQSLNTVIPTTDDLKGMGAIKTDNVDS